MHDAFYGPINIPGMGVLSATHIQELSWRIDFNVNDYIAYDMTYNNVYIYNDFNSLGIPGVDERLPLNVGGSSTIRKVLVNQPLAVLDTDLRMLTVLEEYYDWTMPTGWLATGDINNDGAVNLFDAILALQLMSGIQPNTLVYKQFARQGDAKIRLGDAIHALNITATQ